MDVFDHFLMGEIDFIEWDFNNIHFNERIKENYINKEDIIRVLKEEEPVDYEKDKNNRYLVYYTCESLNTNSLFKDHLYYKIVLHCNNNKITVITIIPETKLFNDNKHKQKEKLIFKAHQRRI